MFLKSNQMMNPFTYYLARYIVLSVLDEILKKHEVITFLRTWWHVVHKNVSSS